mmetsp:Transcript_2044/g.4083  ORF Transcript_2044/g.4083 Transcript_2044/m.4083 type:complete len:263 (+) Transcript_2044:363-1151(+)
MPPSTSTPMLRLASPSLCILRSLFSTSIESKPAFSARVLGITSKARAKLNSTNCSLPSINLACSRSYLLRRISMLPPPTTVSWLAFTRLTIWIASLSERSASEMYCSDPPLKMMVEDLTGGSWKRFQRSIPIWISSNFLQLPQYSGLRPLHVVWMIALTDLARRLRSSSLTRPAQNILRSANYWVARSPIGSLDSTICTPKLAMLSSFSYMIFHSASTMLCYLEGSEILISALSFSALSSNSTFSSRILGFSNYLGCCSKPA